MNIAADLENGLIISQYVDTKGKTIALSYKNNLSLIISPLPPLDVAVEKTIKRVSLEVAIKFIKEKGFKIEYQEKVTDKNEISGLWLLPNIENSQIIYAYIPLLEGSPIIENVEFQDPMKLDPVSVDLKKDSFEEFHRNRKIASILKQYTCYAYALSEKKDKFFDIPPFRVKESHKYVLEKIGKMFTISDNTIFEGSKVIVTSESIRDKLLTYLKVELLNDKEGVLDYKNKIYYEDYFTTLSDFRSSPSSILFFDKESLVKYNRSTKPPKTFSNFIDVETGEPYFYRHPKMENSRPMIIQNVESQSKDNALKVSKRWVQDRVNIGYFPPKDIEMKEKYEVVIYDINGTKNIDSEFSKEEKVFLLRLSKNKYASMLFL